MLDEVKNSLTIYKRHMGGDLGGYSHFIENPSKIVDTLNPKMVYDLFKRIPAVDLPFIMMSEELSGRPENMLMTSILVPPICIR